jgi:multiple sugar transport system ATP-binding protein
MNFVTAKAVRDDGPAVVFAGHRLPIPPAVVEARPGLERFFGRELILGVRPSDFEDAALADPGWATMPVEARVTEELGSEIHVIFTIDAPIVQHASLSQAISDEDDDSAIALAGGESQWTARVAARSHVKPGQRLDLALDTSNLHFFDPAAGRTRVRLETPELLRGRGVGPRARTSQRRGGHCLIGDPVQHVPTGRCALR